MNPQQETEDRRRETSGLPKDSVANTSQIVSLDRSVLTEQAGRLSAKKLQLVMAGIDVVLGR
jgi:mRNA interferase MazF